VVEVHAPTAVEPVETVQVTLSEPAFGIAPGQACVIYAGSRVVGSATIARTRRLTSA
jgi:tRNA-specific 2-thiouridylase